MNHVGNTVWCLCDKCIPQATPENGTCCKEVPIGTQLAEGLQCLVDLPEWTRTDRQASIMGIRTVHTQGILADAVTTVAISFYCKAWGSGF